MTCRSGSDSRFEAEQTGQTEQEPDPPPVTTIAWRLVRINREVMHHGGEIGVLSDLYRAGLR